MEYTNNLYNKEIIDYFFKEQLNKYFNKEEMEHLTHKYIYTDPNFAVNPNNKIPYPPDLNDLVRLHKIIRTRKCFIILEFGLGFSTFIMADALYKNKLEFETLHINNIRCNSKFEIHSIDTDKYWVDKLKEKLEDEIYSDINKLIFIYNTECNIGTFQDRICHYYDYIPDIIPDFIYLDGPSAYSVTGNIKNLTFKQLDRTVMSGDLLLMEPTFIPGLLILIDGRSNNAYFLKNNFQRNYNYKYSKDNDIHTFELIDKPLGEYNLNKLKYCNINL